MPAFPEVIVYLRLMAKIIPDHRVDIGQLERRILLRDSYRSGCSRTTLVRP
jgi:hypothetical protein